ncbi:hypothetical protein HELRODRAFT_193616 [Helobdella robusta]|uniref:P/Homo B domain-containing protein n=1 Tax=Helobdella robusta TaxID=6412 RepID=T1FV66_HELRO|nr:hypothetical protein HELRODRAFT_193616 [Helobdella robusta]ESN95278.1 hypothetical protein HELRODRAFT_193616 [Helobdella robusta]
MSHDQVIRSRAQIKLAELQRPLKRYKRDLISIDSKHEVRAYREINFNDDFWENQWYLHDTKPARMLPKIDLHVIPVWANNITGRGVVVTIIDDGLEHNHTDLHRNYDPKASWDFNDNDSDPFPRYDESDENKHGTRCAGEVAMVENNNFCAVGIAFNANIGGIRVLDGVTTDRLEALSLSYNVDHIDIMSASWGPSDDGKSLEKPGMLAQAALEKGVTKGRGGKGVIYVWASGNGGISKDNCNCDGYTGSIYTLSISSASEWFNSPWYAEHCPSTIASTYSSGVYGEQRVISTDLHNQCTTAHSGTSASAPLAAGIIALVLEANPNLTWRDVQHLVAWTSEYEPLRKNKGWMVNGAGFWVNNRFGFGLLNAAMLVEAADPKVFKSVPKQSLCIAMPEPSALPRKLMSKTSLEVAVWSDACETADNLVNYIEHVILVLDMNYTRRGNVQVHLKSPSGMVTEMLTVRKTDNATTGFPKWPLSSVHNWGEDPRGLWITTIVDNVEGNHWGYLKGLQIQFYGTSQIPDHVIRGGMKRTYKDYPFESGAEDALDKEQTDEDGEDDAEEDEEWLRRIIDEQEISDVKSRILKMQRHRTS